MKGKYLIAAIAITLILFLGLIYTEKKIAGAEQKVSVLIVKQNITINKYDKLSAEMFELKDIPTFLGVNAISDIKEIDSTYALTSLNGGDILKKDKIGGKTEVPIISINPSKRKIAIPVSNIADAVGGQIKKDSYVDILYTNSPTTEEPVVKTETIFEKIKVIGITDANGMLIDESSDNQIGSVLLEVSPQEAHVLVNKERKGKFRLIGVPENSQMYDKITVR